MQSVRADETAAPHLLTIGEGDADALTLDVKAGTGGAQVHHARPERPQQHLLKLRAEQPHRRLAHLAAQHLHVQAGEHLAIPPVHHRLTPRAPRGGHLPGEPQRLEGTHRVGPERQPGAEGPPGLGSLVHRDLETRLAERDGGTQPPNPSADDDDSA